VGRFRSDVRTIARASPHLPRSSKQFGQSQDAIKRSINLALSVRGQSALAAAGVLGEVMETAVPMPCRAIHLHSGGLVTQAYGMPGQAIYSVSREAVNRILLAECAKHGASVRVHFAADVSRIDAASGEITVAVAGGKPRSYKPRLIVGADGAYSRVREALLRVCRADFARKFIPHGYKELTIPAGPVGTYVLPEPNALHIWPRTAFMLIALPNAGGSFTCTLFAPYETLDALDADPTTSRAFFQQHFPDTLPFLPDLEAQIKANPTSSLVETRLRPYEWAGRLVLVGDAAHSTVPFYGQGMNAALEDCLVLAEALDAAGGDVAPAVRSYSVMRQPAGLALCDLSMGNYDEMKASTASWAFRARVRAEKVLHALFPAAWIPQYSMVAFTRIPYHEVVKRAAAQDEAIDAAVAVAAGVVAVALGVAAWVVADKRGVALPRLSLSWSRR
jgi:kynurenine 3-monooxygenase